MNTLARFLAVYLVLVFADAFAGFGLYRRVVHAGTGLYCTLTRREKWEQYQCTDSLFYSHTLWVAISVLMGLAGGYVTLQALATKKW